MNKTTITITTLLALFPAVCYAQIYNDWERRDTIVTSMNEGTVKETDYAAQGIFMDWSTVLDDFDEYDGDTTLDVIRAKVIPTKTEVTSLKGVTFTLPTLPDENGVDLFMLTYEGIYIYMAMDEPVYFMEPEEDIIKWIRYYAYDKRTYTQRIFNRYKNWEPLIKNYFRAMGIPEELAELCLVESGCTYEAISSAGAVGMWQIMPDTGRSHGLKVNDKVDDRKDPVLSTQTAADILLSNYRITGDWTLSAAAYNCGAGRVQRHMIQGRNTWETMKPNLPKETRQYIPCLLAVHYVWTYRDRLGFD